MSKRTKGAPLLLKIITPLFKPREVRPLKTKRRNIFILSSGRTATTFLAELFDTLPEVQAVHEPKPSRILRMWGNAYYNGDASQKFLASVLQKKRKNYRCDDNRIYIESNPFLSPYISLLGKVFPNLTIVHVVRDPRDYVRSAINHGNGRGIKLFFNYCVPFWFPDVERILGLDFKLPMKFKVAAFWTITNKAMLEYGKQHPENYHLLKYEDIFKNDQSDMEKLIDLVGVKENELKSKSISKEGFNRSRYNAVPKWDNWTNEECQLLDTLCQPLMSELGYGNEPEWKTRVETSK